MASLVFETVQMRRNIIISGPRINERNEGGQNWERSREKQGVAFGLDGQGGRFFRIGSLPDFLILA